MVKRLHTWVFADLILIGLAAVAGASVLHVPGQYPTIQTGLNAASYGDTVLVAPGTYHEHWIMMANGVTLASSHGMDSTIIDADSLGPVIVCDGVDDQTVISGFTIQHGYYPCGGGIICYAASPVIEDNWIRNNEAYDSWGGGIECEMGASPTIIRNRFEANEVPYSGGAIACHLATSPRIYENLIIGNVAAAYGGAISAQGGGGTVEIVDNVIVNNTALHYGGGGIKLWVVNALVLGNVIRGNMVESGGGVGGGIYARSTVGTVIARNLIEGNLAHYGGGIGCFDEGSPLIANNTIHANASMPEGGGGIYCIDSSSPTVVDNIISGTLHGGGMAVGDTGSLPTIAYNDVWNNAGGDYLGCEPGIGDISENPMFVLAERRDHRLLWPSPCIDAGHPDSLDPDGTRRDMGAYLFDQDDYLTLYITPDTTEVVRDAQLGVTYTVINRWFQPEPFWMLSEVIRPSGDTLGVLGPAPYTLPPDTTIQRHYSFDVPDAAPLGEYEYRSGIGIAPATLYDEDQFTFTVRMAVPCSTRTWRVPDECPTIQAGIDSASNGDTVMVADGLYTGEGNRDVFFLGKAIVVMSENGPGRTIIDCQQSGRGFCFSGEGPNAVLRGFTISNGHTTNGGGIYCHNASPTIYGNIVRANTAEDAGGGIHCSTSSFPTLIGNTITGNRAERGGGVYCLDSSPTLINSVLWSDSASTGPEVYLSNDYGLVSSMSVSYSNAEGGLGAVYVAPGCTLYCGEGNIDDDPMFVLGERGDYRLLWQSPCIDAGHPDSLDPDGTRRDMGAYSFDQSKMLVTYATPETRTLERGENCRVLYTLANCHAHSVPAGGIVELTLPNGEPWPGNPLEGPGYGIVPPEFNWQ
ncbi:hypothetical protein AMJ71_10990, partial [candidate division TA06 bacterium SM1_40]